MAGYNANINISVSGLNRLNYVLNSVEKINAIVSKLKPINLLSPGAGAGGDAIRVAKKQIDDFARALVNFKPEGIQKRAKELSTTLAGSAEQAQGLATALANVGLKSGGFKQQAAEVRNYALALDTARQNAVRLNTISQTVQRQARVENIATRFGVSSEQVEQRITNIRNIRYKKDRQAEINAIRAARRAEDFEIRLGRIQEKNRAKQRQQAARGNRNLGISDAVIGGAFPLLFGQGVGASLGGALGGGIGARVGGGKGGFGGSLVGTLTGQATIDFAINSAVKLGQALQDPTEKIDDLIGFLGIAGTALNSNIKVLRALGLSSTASAVALAQLEIALQKEGFKNAQEFSKDLQTLSNAFGRLQLAAANLANGALPGILDALTEILKGAGQAPLAPVLAPKTLSPAEAITQAQAKNFIGPQPDSALTAERVAQKAITNEKQRQISLATAQKNLEADTLSLTRVELATRQGAISIQQVQNDLARKQLELKNETVQSTKELLGLEVQVLQQQQQQAIAAQRNAQIEAERQVTRQIGGLMIEQTELENQIFTLRSESAKLLGGEALGLASALNSIETRRKNELGILYVRRDLERLGINEIAVLEEINTKYDGLASAVQHRYNNEKLTLEQQQAQYELTQRQIQQERDLAKLQATGQAGLQLQQLRSFADPAGIGFFGEAIINQKLALEEFSVALQLYDQQLLNLEERLAVPGLNPDTLLALQQQKDALLDSIAVYKEYQPAIIQAKLEQEKFNAVFSAVSPLVDNVFNSFTQLIAGTMSAKEAFASFLSAVSDLLLQTAKQMISTYIAIGIAKIFAGLGGGIQSAGSSAGPAAFGGGGPTFNPGAFSMPTLAANGATFSNGIAKFASGGVVGSPTLFKFADGGTTKTGLMGEAGPEAIMPLKRDGSGRLGVNASGLREAMASGGSGAGGGTTLNMSFETSTINGVEYVSRDQLEQAMAQTRKDASRDGARRGMTMTLDKLQQSPGTRGKVGLR